MSDLKTECFIAAFRRFVFRQENHFHVHSDTGKIFIGANSELNKLGAFILDQNQSTSER